jgi:hypothetical protein
MITAVIENAFANDPYRRRFCISHLAPWRLGARKLLSIAVA